MTDDYYTTRKAGERFVETVEDMRIHPDLYRGAYFPSPWFMEVTGGIRKTWVVTVLGQSGLGKSTFLVSAAVENGKRGVPFVYFSKEESVELITSRFFSNIESINRLKFRDASLTPSDMIDVHNANSQFVSYPGVIVDTASSDIEIVETLKKLERDLKFVPVMVYLDYHQLYTVETGQQWTNKTAEVSAFSKFLVQLVKGRTGWKHECAVIAAAQLNDNNEPLWSKDLNRDSDIAIEVGGIDDGSGSIPKRYIPNRRILNVRKNRHGLTDKMEWGFWGAWSKIGEIASPQIQSPQP